MIKILIDGQPLDLDQTTEIAITYAVADITDPDSSSSGYSKTIEVPYTPTNLAIMKHTNEVFSREQFNNEQHSVEIIVDDNTVMTGVATLEKCTVQYWNPQRQQNGTYHISIVGSAYEWISTLDSQINELTSTEVVNYTLPNVYANSVNTSATLIKFFPIDKGAFYIEDDDDYKPRYYLDLNDYHPFINVWKALELILGGFKVVSSLESLFLKLYFAGSIVEDENLSYIKEDNDFIIRLVSTDLSFDNPSTPTDCSMIYNWSSDDDFVTTEGVVYLNDFAAYFKPTATCTVQFCLAFAYTAYVTSRGKYMDMLTFGEAEEQTQFLPTDSLEAASAVSTASELVEGKVYYVYLKFADVSKYEGCTLRFYYTASVTHPSSYSFRASRDLISSVSSETEYCRLAVVIAELQDGAQSYGAMSGFGLYLEDSSESYNLASVDDVEVYLIPLGEDYSMSFSTTITSVTYRCTEGQSYKLYTALSSTCNYSSSESGEITLGAACQLYPIFGSSLAYGTDVSIADIGGEDTQLDLLKSLRSMYNLMFYTNALTRTIYIEPRSSFYELNGAKVVDWRGKLDYSNEIEIIELGEDTGTSLYLSYGETTDVIDYYNWKNNTEVGAYTEALLNKVSSDSDTEISIDLFAPFILRDVDSVGMELPQDKQETEQMEIGDADVNITLIIGYFNGVSTRYSGTDLEEYPQYPAMIFQDAGSGVNLGFDDVSIPSMSIIGKPSITYVAEGLKQYYADNIRAYNYGRQIVAYMKLEPHDIESIVYPRDEAHRDLRSVYLLEVDGEVIPCTLEEISDYQPASGKSTKCTFLSDPNIEIEDAALTVITYNDTAISQDEDTLIGY